MTRRFIITCSLIAFILCSSCARGAKGESANLTEADSASTVVSSGWYYVTEAGIHAAKSPADIPQTSFKPWTESVRAVDMTYIDGRPAILVNRLGVMLGKTSQEGARLHRLPREFADATAGGFVAQDGGYGVRLYRNETFYRNGGETDNAEVNASQTPAVIPFLLRFGSNSGIFEPWLYARDLGASEIAHCVALDRVGPKWYASFKSETASRVDFTYLEFDSLPNEESSVKPTIRTIDADSWREAVRPFAFSELPSVLASLFASVPEDASLSIRARGRTEGFAAIWTREGEGQSLSVEAIVGKRQAAALFSDGTFIVSNGSDTKAFKLPKLSPGYAYGVFMIAGESLVAAWEEQRFFETGRTGLLEIALPEGIYWDE